MTNQDHQFSDTIALPDGRQWTIIPATRFALDLPHLTLTSALGTTGQILYMIAHDGGYLEARLELVGHPFNSGSTSIRNTPRLVVNYSRGEQGPVITNYAGRLGEHRPFEKMYQETVNVIGGALTHRTGGQRAQNDCFPNTPNSTPVINGALNLFRVLPQAFQDQLGPIYQQTPMNVGNEFPSLKESYPRIFYPRILSFP